MTRNDGSCKPITSSESRLATTALQQIDAQWQTYERLFGRLNWKRFPEGRDHTPEDKMNIWILNFLTVGLIHSDA